MKTPYKPTHVIRGGVGGKMRCTSLEMVLFIYKPVRTVFHQLNSVWFSVHSSPNGISVGQNFHWIKWSQSGWLKWCLGLSHKWNICPAVIKMSAVFINLIKGWLINHRPEKLKQLLQAESQLCWHEREVILLKSVLLPQTFPALSATRIWFSPPNYLLSGLSFSSVTHHHLATNPLAFVKVFFVANSAILVSI